MPTELAKFLALGATALGLLGALATTFDALGSQAAVWALLATGGTAVAGSLAGVWISARQTIRHYAEASTEAARTRASRGGRRQERPSATVADLVYRRAEVVPAFADAGLDRTRTFFLGLVDEVESQEEERRREKAFVESVYGDESLSKREKIEKLVEHFAPRGEAPEDTPGT